MINLVDGIPSTDMTSAVQTSLGKADTALQEHQDITGKEDKTNKVTSVDENSTNTQYPSAKLFYDKTTDLQEKYETLKNDHPPIEATNTELTLNGTGDFDLELNPKGNITQETREGYNILDLSSLTSKIVYGLTITRTDDIISITGRRDNSGWVGIINAPLSAGTYTFSYESSGTAPQRPRILNSSYQQQNDTFTVSETGTYIIAIGGAVDDEWNCTLKLQIVSGTTAKPYEKYGASPSPSYPSPVKVIDGSYDLLVANSDNTQTQTQTIDTSPNPLYSEDDYYYKQNGNWYVHNEWGKVVLNGTEDWTIQVYSSLYYYRLSTTIPDQSEGYSNYFTVISSNLNLLAYTNVIRIKDSNIDLVLDKSNISLENFKTWLSTHNTEIIYELATPTNTQITNTTLINQLEALSNMKAYQDQTNISQTHNTAQADMKINAKTIMSLRYMQQEIESLLNS